MLRRDEFDTQKLTEWDMTKNIVFLIVFFLIYYGYLFVYPVISVNYKIVFCVFTRAEGRGGNNYSVALVLCI